VVISSNQSLQVGTRVDEEQKLKSCRFDLRQESSEDATGMQDGQHLQFSIQHSSAIDHNIIHSRLAISLSDNNHR
jgi:hypothetical protein